jgi:hypothetical protein
MKRLTQAIKDSLSEISHRGKAEDLPMNEEPRKEGTDPNPDEVLRKMLGTPPQPRKPKIKEAKPEK